ncbi:aldehyde dehydrogenase family protein [Streptomyces malaysiensis]|uniref:aldehyde dehydrogenase family protein n=1 Tax=Streptomyces malaysiensis TaxID=92644 RepID=UPI003FA7D027
MTAQFHDRVAEELVRAVSSLRVGAPADPGTEMGPLAHAAHAERVRGFLDRAAEAGARSGGCRVPLDQRPAPPRRRRPSAPPGGRETRPGQGAAARDPLGHRVAPLLRAPVAAVRRYRSAVSNSASRRRRRGHSNHGQGP